MQVLFPDFVAIHTYIKHMGLRKVIKVVVIMMIDNFEGVYQISCQMSELE